MEAEILAKQEEVRHWELTGTPSKHAGLTGAPWGELCGIIWKLPEGERRISLSAALTLNF